VFDGRVRPLSLSMLLIACATTEPAAPKPHALAPAYPSSLGAVLAHTSELELTPDQVRKLNELEERRQRLDDQTRSAAHSQSQASDTSSTPPPRGGGRGMGRRGGGTQQHAQASHDPQVNQQYDDHDTQAFTAGLELLTEAQKPRAVELASKYREELFNYREQLAGESRDR